MVIGRTPIATAASTNSLFLIDSVCPRAIRAMSSQEISPMPMNSIRIDRPKITSIRISTNIYGTDIRISTVRIISISVRAPK